jgi:hypothetical protein
VSSPSRLSANFHTLCDPKLPASSFYLSSMACDFLIAATQVYLFHRSRPARGRFVMPIDFQSYRLIFVKTRWSHHQIDRACCQRRSDNNVTLSPAQRHSTTDSSFQYRCHAISHTGMHFKGRSHPTDKLSFPVSRLPP